MKKIIIFAGLLMLFSHSVFAQDPGTPVSEEAGEAQESEERDAGWDTTVGNEIDDAVKEICDKAFEKLMGVNYEPIALLGTEETEDGKVYCILSRASVVYPGAKPYYVLAYICEKGEEVQVQNIYELWLSAHSGNES